MLIHNHPHPAGKNRLFFHGCQGRKTTGGNWWKRGRKAAKWCVNRGHFFRLMKLRSVQAALIEQKGKNLCKYSYIGIYFGQWHDTIRGSGGKNELLKKGFEEKDCGDIHGRMVVWVGQVVCASFSRLYTEYNPYGIFENICWLKICSG